LIGAIECGDCGATFDVVWGTPFLGHYEASDIPGLLEIAANARGDSASASRQDVERIAELLQRYDAVDDKLAFRVTCRDHFARAPWFANRYSEYSAFRALTDGIEFDGHEVLDVGAGAGYDTWRLVQAGARVTAFDYNPALIRRGKLVAPQARWIGGLAHVLPFQAETFDVVCCNAALHHMRDVTGTITEMLRVLRPGGWLLTTGDPFRADASGEHTELAAFDSHPDVLLGVNESIPRFSDLVGALVAHEDRLSVSFVGARDSLLRRFLSKNTPSRTEEWSLDDTDRLAKASGSISIKARVSQSLGLPPRRQRSTVLRAGAYAAVLDDYDSALAALLPILPSSLVDPPFPGKRQTKLELLNGWQKPALGRQFRTAYRRARWFLTRPPDADTLRFWAKATGRGGASLEIRIGRMPTTHHPLHATWSEVLVSLAAVQPEARFICELRAVPSVDDPGFDDYRFAVKGREFACSLVIP
jgi:SAM-dependent methyltransferase